MQGLQGFLHASIAFAAQGLQGLQGSVASAMHSSTVFFAAQGLQGLQAARATPVLPIAAIDTAAAIASGFRADRLESSLVGFILIRPNK